MNYSDHTVFYLGSFNLYTTRSNIQVEPPMSLFQKKFGIKDLEEFSGVKAHTIRIWEKRYGLLSPDRTGTNIRYYSLEELRVIMNVAFLNEHGHKISRIAAMTPVERERLVRETAAAKDPVQGRVNKLKIAMLAFDEADFEQVTREYEQEVGFRGLVEGLYVPLLERIGVLWQTSAICPAHEHFVSNIIRQRLISATGSLPRLDSSNDRTYILHLPENEIHELGLLYVNYMLREQGERTIYLGQSVPEDDLKQVAANRAGELHFISFITINPPLPEVPAYLARLRALLPDRRITVMIAGSQLTKLAETEVPPGVLLYPTMKDLVAALPKPR